jgi:HEPN domain-containing protein
MSGYPNKIIKNKFLLKSFKYFMTIEEHIAYWLDSADYDLQAANSLLNNGYYVWCLFIGHLVLEKALKVLYVKVNNNKVPPKIHNLLKLAEISNINLTLEQSKFLSDVNRFQIEGRYPEFKTELYKIATKEFAINHINKIEEYYKWFKSLIK